MDGRGKGMVMKRWVLCLVLCIVFGATAGWAAELPKAKADGAYPMMEGLDLFLSHGPKVIREAAELYCIRLEFIGHLYSRKKRDGAVDESIERLGRTVRNLGMCGLNGIVALRERLPYEKIKGMVKGWRKKSAAGGEAAGGGKSQAVARRIGTRVGRGIRRRLGSINMLRAQMTESIKALQLTEAQRRELKLQVVTSMPAIIRSGAALVADFMELGREYIKPELPVKSCAERIVRMSDGVKDLARSGLDLAFSLKGRLDAGQQKRFLANLPLRLILFR